jgi:hypothetical protein
MHNGGIESMRSLLLIAALVALPVAWIAIIWLTVRDRAPVLFSNVAAGERLNIALLILAVVSTLVALIGVGIGVAAYRQASALARWQLEAGNQQSQTLRSQAEALAAAREALASLVQVSNRSREALEAEIELARQQRALEEARRSAPRPRIELDFGSTSWGTLRQVLDHRRKIAVSREEFRAGRTRFTVRNVGETTLRRPVVIISASDPQIDVSPRQFSGPAVQDLVPFTMAGKGYTYEAKINVPGSVGSFELKFEIFGENMPAREVVLPIVLVEWPGTSLTPRANLEHSSVR